MASVTENQLYENALQLSKPERARLAARLLESLDDVTDPDAEQAWADEIARRIEALDSGAETTIPWAEARRFITGEIDEPAAS